MHRADSRPPSSQAWEAVDLSEIDPTSKGPYRGIKRILLVDPEPASLALLQRICEAWDAQVELAQNAEEGLRKLTDNSYDLLISELYLSDMPAEKFLKIIRDNLLLAPEQIVFLGRERPDAVREFVASSGCGYCRKPPRLSELLREVEGRFSGNESEKTTTSEVIL